MSLVIDYFFSPQSPWTYLGHQRFADDRARRPARTINVLPVDLGGKVFPVSGGLPLAQARAAAPGLPAGRAASASASTSACRSTCTRSSFRCAERRGVAADHRGRPARRRRRGDGAHRRRDARRVGRRTQHRRRADAGRAARRRSACRRSASTTHSRRPCRRATTPDSQRAIDTGVFGAPSYVVDGELFWGQDRLDFVQRRLAAG